MRGLAAALGAIAALGGAAVASARADVVRAGSVYARVTATEVVLGNGVSERRWAREGFRTTELVDKRGGGRTWSREHRDFTLTLAGGAAVGSEGFAVDGVAIRRLRRGGLRVTMTLAGGLPGVTVARTAEAYPGIAGFKMGTTLRSSIPLALAGATLDEAAVGSGAAATLHAFRAGSDWREPSWPGPPLAIGDPHAGDWRASSSAGAGRPLEGPAQWLALNARGRGLFMVMERNDFPSSRAAFDGAVATVRVDYGRDVLSLAPLEEDAHVENPLPPGSPGRVRIVGPGAPLALGTVFTGMSDHDGDDAWQFHRYLVGHRLAPYPHDVVFNSDGTDANRISTGSKDDMDYATVEQVAPIARRMGFDTFVLDDGWQATSGDWQPDSPRYREPRGRFPPRFPDATFAAVRAAIAPMKLGLWMSPANFNPAASVFHDHPDWACAPVGDATAIVNAAQPDDGSNEAGIGFWGPRAFPFVESRIRDAIEHWGVRFFKFDFLAWLDCVGQGDLYAMHDAFLAMLDRLRRDYPDVVFEIDETNDYRLFPFESVSRGPTWFQNGSPPPAQLLHELWDLSPYVPASAIGQKALAGDTYRHYPVATLMAGALLSHLIVAGDLRALPDAVIDEARPWIDFYKAHRGRELNGVVYPLLDDPLRGSWTALQSWNPDSARGALLAFRQDSPSPTQRIALRNVPPDRTFDLVGAPDGQMLGTATSRELRDGLEVTVPELHGASVLLIEPR